MFFELIAVLVAGAGGAGLLLLVSRLSGGRLPRWLIPVGAGAAMIATSVSAEYSWFPRSRDTLPDHFAVAEVHQSRALWRPWTHVVPMVDRFIAVDGGNLRANEQTEGLYLADLYFFARWQPVRVVQMMVDCPGGRRADPMGGDGGAPVWREVGAQDPVLRTVCEEAGA
ncbi:MAG: hypothetical protein ACU0A5_17080 [Salipiger marinus]|uniref:hypothetical protein n=1 Tax=Salipiger marinus TaxID=555512 RepID=UPI0040586DD7